MYLIRRAIKRKISFGINKDSIDFYQSPFDAPNKPRFEPTEYSPVFVVGTGRSGTHFMARLMRHDDRIASFHEETLDSIGDSFVRFVTWHNLPIDLSSFLYSRQSLIERAAKVGWVYFESNAYISHNIDDLSNAFDGKFIHIYRTPEAVVNSHLKKGWYSNDYVISDTELIPGYQYGVQRPNHFFGRITPRGQELERWLSLSQIGRIAWMWNTINMAIIEQTRHLPTEKHLLVKLEDIDYELYRQIHSYCNGLHPMTASQFQQAVKVSDKNKGTYQKEIQELWSTLERNEFLLETQQAREALGVY